jgi:hypothetical protein
VLLALVLLFLGWVVGWAMNGWDSTDGLVSHLSHTLRVGHGTRPSHGLSVEPMAAAAPGTSERASMADTQLPQFTPLQLADLRQATASAFNDASSKAATAAPDTPAELSPALNLPGDELLPQATPTPAPQPALTVPEPAPAPVSTAPEPEPATQSLPSDRAGNGGGRDGVGVYGVRPDTVQWTGVPLRRWSDTWAAIPDTFGPRAGCAPGCSTYGVCNEVSSTPGVTTSARSLPLGGRVQAGFRQATDSRISPVVAVVGAIMS